MLHIRDILVATDFSDSSEQALRLAISAARKTGARLHLVFVQVLHADPFAPSTYPADHRDRVVEALRNQYDKVVGEMTIPAARLPDVTFEVLHDAAVTPALVRYVHESDIDLIVAGTHGRRGIRHMMLGSVAEELVRSASCPVVTVRSDAVIGSAENDPGREILIPVDFSSHSLVAVHAGRELAALFGLGIRVLHVVEESLHPAFYNAGAFSIYDLRPDVEEHAWAHLEQVLRDTPGPSVTVKLEVTDGRAADQIVTTARDTGARMIVMSTHGLTGLAHLFMGSVAEHVVRTAPCPVFVVKSYGKSLFETMHTEDHAIAD